MTSIMLSFTPSLPCYIEGCEQLTTIGQLSLEQRNMQLSPVCPLHGLMFECSLEDQYTSIARFVVSEYKGKGSATVIGSCSLKDVPSFNPDYARPDQQDIEALSAYERMHVDDIAWSVRYTSELQLEQVVYVTWSIDFLDFTLHTEQESESWS